VPTGVKIINWIATMWGGSLRFTTAMKFAAGLVAMFTIGGVSGVTHAVAPMDTQQTDTYYIVAHFHYVLFGGALLGLFSGMYYWWPKMFGRMLNERLGSIHFWLFIIGLNLTFGPMHIVGLQGMARRYYRYGEGEGFEVWNLVMTIGAFIIALGTLVFLINAVLSRRNPIAPLDPWDARSVEWLTTSPPKPHNFDETPTVTHLDEFFHRKYEEDPATGRLTRVRTAEELVVEAEARARASGELEHMHLPSPSYWPLVVSIGLPLIGYGLIFTEVLAVVGGLIVLAGLYGWALEPSVDPTTGHGEQDPHDPHGPAGPSQGELATVG
jgi:cytochrome c oxidase subunit 1